MALFATDRSGVVGTTVEVTVMYEIMPRTEGRRLGVRIRGDLTEEDVEELRADLREFVWRFGSVRLLVVLEEWTGWDGWRALWEDLKTDAALNREVERLAMVRRGPAGRWMTQVLEPFAHAEMRWFEATEIDGAWEWLGGGGSPAA